jgi:hypothetical protein
MVVPTDFPCPLTHTLPRSPHNFSFLTNFSLPITSCLIMVHTRRSPLSQPSTVVTRSTNVSIIFALVSKNEDRRYSYEVCRACAFSHFPMLCPIFFSLLMTMLVSSPLLRPLGMLACIGKSQSIMCHSGQRRDLPPVTYFPMHHYRYFRTPSVLILVHQISGPCVLIPVHPIPMSLFPFRPSMLLSRLQLFGNKLVLHKTDVPLAS